MEPMPSSDCRSLAARRQHALQRPEGGPAGRRGRTAAGEFRPSRGSHGGSGLDPAPRVSSDSRIPRQRGEVEQFGVRQRVELDSVVATVPYAARGGVIVAHDQLRSVSLPPTSSSSCSDSSRPSVPSSTMRSRSPADAAHHLEPLRHRRTSRTVTRSSISRAEAAAHLVEARSCSARGWRAPGWPGTGSCAGVLEDVAPPADVERDDVHRLAHRDHREPGLLGDPLGGAVPGARFVGRDRGVGHQLDAARSDAVAVAGETTAPSILASSRSRVGGEADVEGETAGADRLDRLVVAQDDQGSGAAAQDALEPVAQRGAGRQPSERLAQRSAAPPVPSRRCGTDQELAPAHCPTASGPSPCPAVARRRRRDGDVRDGRASSATRRRWWRDSMARSPCGTGPQPAGTTAR